MRIQMLPGLILVLGLAVAMVLPVPPPPPREGAGSNESSDSPVSAQLRQQIDAWIASRGLNEYGDPPGTMYIGGTPLFDERTGRYTDRYLYILERHPELKDDGSRKR